VGRIREEERVRGRERGKGVLSKSRIVSNLMRPMGMFLPFSTAAGMSKPSLCAWFESSTIFLARSPPQPPLSRPAGGRPWAEGCGCLMQSQRVAESRTVTATKPRLESILLLEGAAASSSPRPRAPSKTSWFREGGNSTL